MSKIKVYVEVKQEKPVSGSMTMFSQLKVDSFESVKSSEKIISKLAGFGLEVTSDAPPIPMFSNETIFAEKNGFATFGIPEENDDVEADSYVVLCDAKASELEKLAKKTGVSIYAYIEPELFDKTCNCYNPASISRQFVENDVFSSFDLTRSSNGVDSPPFRPAVNMSTIRMLLGVSRAWENGYTGQNIFVGIVDEGVNQFYPVVGGWAELGSYPPGSAPITSHGSMCAADILVAAPSAKILDYPIFTKNGEGLDPLPVWISILNQRRINGTPHLTNNSYGFYSIPQGNLSTPATDLMHPINRAIKNAVISGITCFFAAGNCGSPNPTAICDYNRSSPVPINGANSLEEVITVGAVNSYRERIGYSSQGPGFFHKQKPDISAYSHFYGNFGPDRPGGTAQPFDNGTSAACPVACGVGALLQSAFPLLAPNQISELLKRTAIEMGLPGFDTDYGFGVINAGAAYDLLKNSSQSEKLRNKLSDSFFNQ